MVQHTSVRAVMGGPGEKQRQSAHLQGKDKLHALRVAALGRAVPACHLALGLGITTRIELLHSTCYHSTKGVQWPVPKCLNNLPPA